MSEIHVRKVREVETGGSPTPLDSPYRLVMNLGHTGFNKWHDHKPLFKPIEIQEPKTGKLNFSPNSDFLQKKSVTLPSEATKKDNYAQA